MDPKNGTPAPSAAQANVSMSYEGEFTVGMLHLRSTDRGVNLRHDKVGSTGITKTKKSADVPAAPTGFGANGELRIGAITLALSADGDQLRLRRENVGHQTETDAEIFAELIGDVFFADHKTGQPAEREVAEAGIEGVLEAAFFTRRIEKDGSVKTNLDSVRSQKA